MKRLTIHLQKFEKGEGDKHPKNTFSFIINNDREIPQHLAQFEGNVKKHYISNIKY